MVDFWVLVFVILTFLFFLCFPKDTWEPTASVWLGRTKLYRVRAKEKIYFQKKISLGSSQTVCSFFFWVHIDWPTVNIDGGCVVLSRELYLEFFPPWVYLYHLLSRYLDIMQIRLSLLNSVQLATLITLVYIWRNVLIFHAWVLFSLLKCSTSLNTFHLNHNLMKFWWVYIKWDVHI